MRKLNAIIKLSDAMEGYMEIPSREAEVMALDENGELWSGELKRTEDNRRVIDWTPVNTPKDGAGFSEPQLDFFDRWEKEARARLQADIDASGEAVPLATDEQTDARSTGEEAEGASDDSVEDGKGSDPG